MIEVITFSFDWNGDGLNDLLILPTGDPEINGVVGLFFKKEKMDKSSI